MKKLLITIIMLLAPSLCLSEIYQIHIAAHGNKPDGDIVSIRPDATATTGGRKSRKQYLFVRVDMGPNMKTLNEGRNMMIEHYANGTLVRPETGLEPEVLADNRYQIDFAKLDTQAKLKGIVIDWKKVKDTEVDYQPLMGTVLNYSDLITDKHKLYTLDITGATLKTDLEIKAIADANKAQTISH